MKFRRIYLESNTVGKRVNFATILMRIIDTVKSNQNILKRAYTYTY